ncbi:hypothetical protein CLM72_09345 [Pseudomonas sp. MYb193]|nr:hypothetical protein CLM72_09345 [Pseudomonas sp. MYb193]
MQGERQKAARIAESVIRHGDLDQAFCAVGASLLAKNVNDNAGFLSERGAREFFASKLAPTGACWD